MSRQLGHADWSVTARHYARWTGGDHYVEPERLRPGEVPADLLARFEANPAAATRPCVDDRAVVKAVRRGAREKRSA